MGSSDSYFSYLFSSGTFTSLLIISQLFSSDISLIFFYSYLFSSGFVLSYFGSTYSDYIWFDGYDFESSVFTNEPVWFDMFAKPEFSFSRRELASRIT